jgi:hypothetical protein
MTHPVSEPSDSRIVQARAAIDDARTLVADLLDDIPKSEWPTRHYLSEARAQLNAALVSLGKVS